MAENSAAAPRILVAIKVDGRDLRVLELAAGLAARKQLELAALLVEDINLFNLAELPFSREIDRVFAVERDLDNLRLSRAYQSRIEQIQQALAQIIQQLQISTSFKVVRGHFIPEAWSSAKEKDILFLCHREPAARPADYRATFLHTRPKPSGSIWALCDGPDVSQRVLSMASELATLESCELYIVLSSKAKESGEILRSRTLSSLPQSVLLAGCHLVQTSHPAEILRLMRQTECRFLVADREAEQLINTLAETTPCPIVIV